MSVSRLPVISGEVADWNDWRWQLRHSITTAAELEALVTLTDDERRGLAAAGELFRVGTTPYYASLMDPTNARCPVALRS